MKSYYMQQAADGQFTVELRDVPAPKPGPGQVLLRVRAAGLNRGEFVAGHGLHKAGEPKPIGTEAAGDVIAVGEGVTRFKVGDAVFGRAPASFSEQVLMPEREVLPKPDRLSWEEAAGVPLTFMVVTDMLYMHGALQADEWLLIAGASSGVGVAALQAAKAIGAKVIGTSGSAEKLDRLKKLGLDVAIQTRAPDFHARVLEATCGKGANLAINTVGGTVFAEVIRSMAFQGRMATVGYVDGVLKGEIDIEALHSKRLTLFGVSNKLRSPTQRAEPVPVFIEQVLPAMVSGRIVPLIDKVFPFDQLAEAKAMMEANQHMGKIVLAMN